MTGAHWQACRPIYPWAWRSGCAMNRERVVAVGQARPGAALERRHCGFPRPACWLRLARRCAGHLGLHDMGPCGRRVSWLVGLDLLMAPALISGSRFMPPMRFAIGLFPVSRSSSYSESRSPTARAIHHHGCRRQNGRFIPRDTQGTQRQPWWCRTSTGIRVRVSAASGRVSPPASGLGSTVAVEGSPRPSCATPAVA